jgi:phospholipid/cholesterol/gamma-HCH transport system substrate-binding protein
LEKVDSGKGTLGKLVNDPGIVSEFNRALVTVNAALDRAERTQIFVEAIPEFSISDQETKTYVGMRLAPRDNTAYIAQIVAAPEGSTTTKVTESTTNGVTTTTREEETNPSGLKFSLQYNKKFWNTGFRVGRGIT